MIKTARLAPDGLVCKDTKNRGEAAMVIQAFKVYKRAWIKHLILVLSILLKHYGG